MKTIYVIMPSNNSVKICDPLHKNQPLEEFTLHGSKIQCIVHIPDHMHYAQALIASEHVGLHLCNLNSLGRA